MIPHYLKSNAVKVNNIADTDQTTKTKTSRALRVNIASTQTRLTDSISSGYLAKSTTSFKSFKNIQESHKRSRKSYHSDSMDELLRTSSEIVENLWTIKSKSNKLIDIFNIKAKEITEAMQDLNIRTIDLRNKLFKGSHY